MKNKKITSIQIESDAHAEFVAEKKGGESHSQTLRRLAKINHVIKQKVPTLKYITEKTTTAIEDCKKSGHISVSIADELLRLVQSLLTDIEKAGVVNE